MDYIRREPRFESDQPVKVTNLEQPGKPLPGRLVNFSANGTRLSLASPLHPGSMVKVELGGTILLGEIVYCQQEGAEYAVGLMLEDALYETDVLKSMSETWAAPAQRTSQPQERTEPLSSIPK